MIPESLLAEEEKIPAKFTASEAQKPPTDFKGMDMMQDGSTITLSHKSYIQNIEISEKTPNTTKPELDRAITKEEHKKLRSTAGKHAWIATCTSPSYSFMASVSLQQYSDHPSIPLSTLLYSIDSLSQAKLNGPSSLSYVPLDEPSIHLRIYADAAFQNLGTKHSQTGYVIYLADKHDNVNLVHWHSSRAPRRPFSTEQAELMALDSAYRATENILTDRYLLFHTKTATLSGKTL
ncbi:MAG: hypothetical protein AAGG81_03640 [Chlamydiota bacterium]